MSPAAPRVITATLNPAVDLTLTVPSPRLGVLNRAHSLQRDASGKGINVSLALARLGRPSTAIALLGGMAGASIEQALQGTGIALRAVPIQGETRYNVKIVDETTGQLTEFNSMGPAIRPEEFEAFKGQLLAAIHPGDMVVFSGSLPLRTSPTTYRDLARLTQEEGALAVVDTHGDALRYALEAEPFLVKPNRDEAQEVLGFPLDNEEAVLQAARRFHEAGARRVVLSLGADGSLFFGPEGAVRAWPPSVAVQSTAGCGDALLAGTILGLVTGSTWEETARFATAVSAATAEMAGTSFPTYEQAVQLLPRVRVEILADR